MTKHHEQEGIELGHLFRCDECGNAYEVEIEKECMGSKYCPGCWEDLDLEVEARPCQGVAPRCANLTTGRLNGDIPCCEDCFENNRIFVEPYPQLTL
jgi:hypothetical protein